MKFNLWMGFTLLVLSVLLITGCGGGRSTATPPPAIAEPTCESVSEPANEPESGMANPAAAYCEVQGYTYEIRTAEDGGQYGVCIGSDGRECEEWALYRGECRLAGEVADKPSTTIECPKGWMVYINSDYGFMFCYPAAWTLDEAAEGDEAAGGRAPRTITLNRGTLRLLIQYKGPAEATVLGPGGRGAGEIVAQGTVVVLGQAISKQALVYEGKAKSVFGSVALPDLELHIQLDDEPGAGVDYGVIELSDEVQAEVDRILGTFVRTSPAS
jgi:putative hemolysin